MLEKIKKKFKLFVSFFKGMGLSESLALTLVLLGGILILTLFIIVIIFALPKTKLEIELSGPETAKVGELITYAVSCKNTGNVTLKNPELVFNYPAYSFPEKGGLIERVEPEQFKGSLEPKEEETFYFKTRLLGTIGEKEEAKCWLNYNTKHKTSQVSKVATFSTQISEVPIDLELDLPSKIPISPETETEFKFRVRYASFIDYSFSNLKLKIDYPPAFSVKESKPEPIEENQWEIPTLKKNEAGAVEIWGKFPQNQEIGKAMDFSAQLFLTISGKEVLLKEVTKNSLTYNPVFLVSQKINGKSEYFSSPGEKLHYQVYFKNMQEKPMRDLVLISVLEGNLYDLFTIQCPKGEFELGDNSITWNGEKVSELRYLQPGEEGEVEFWVGLKSDYKQENISETNAIIKNKISLGGFEEEFRSKVNSKTEIEQEGYFRDKYGFFENSGDHPPKVNEATTYTIVWRIKNYYNLLEDIEIKAPLPPQANVKSIGSVPKGEIRIKGGHVQEVVYPGIPANFKFEHNLCYQMNSNEVKYLQIILKKEVPNVYPEEVGATGYFGRITFNSVIEFQEKYPKEILEPQGLELGTGYVDEFTRLKLDELLTKGVSVTSNEVIWEIKRIEPGVGISSEPWLAAFQISFTPTLAQKEKVAELVGEITFSGKDQWTGEIFSAKDEPIDTTLPDDLTAKGEGKIR